MYLVQHFTNVFVGTRASLLSMLVGHQTAGDELLVPADDERAMKTFSAHFIMPAVLQLYRALGRHYSKGELNFITTQILGFASKKQKHTLSSGTTLRPAKCFWFPALIVIIGTVPALAQEQLLKDRFLGKMLVIRNFYIEPQLRYDSSGNIKGPAKTGEWTIAQFKIEKVLQRNDGFELQGKRIAIGWDKKTDSVAFFEIGPLLLKVEDLSAAMTADKINQLANQIFVVLRDEPQAVPEYWHDLVSGNVVAETDAKGHKTFRLKNFPDWSTPVPKGAALVLTTSAQGSAIYRVGGKVSPPKLLKHREPEFSPLARQARYEGTTILSVTVNEAGGTEDIRVLRPAGFGLDEAAVEAVKTWRFAPARLDGKPVKSAIDVEVTYRFGP